MSLKNYYHIYDISQIKTYVNRKGTNIIKFGAKWCKPCVEIESWYKSISKSYPNVRFISIDYNNSTKPAFRAYKIKGMPTFIGLHKNKYRILMIGASKPVLKKSVENYLKSL